MGNSKALPVLRQKPEYDLIAEVDGKSFHLGYSRISSWTECPAKYRYSYVEKRPATMGPAVRAGQAYHTVLEELLLYKQEKQRLFPLDKTLAFVPEACTAEGLTPAKTKDVVKAVEFWWHTLYAEIDPLVVEDSFEIVRGGVKLTGRIDLVTTGGKIIDHKLSADTWADSRAKYGCQPMIYQWAALDYLVPKYGIEYTGFEYNVVRTFPSPVCQHILIEPLAQAESDWWEEQINQIGRAIAAGFFPANPKEHACGFCQYKKECAPTIYTPKIEKRSLEDGDED